MALNANRILDVATWRPPTRRSKQVLPSGVAVTVVERIPGITHETWLHPCGNVVPLALGNANARAEGGKTPAYEQIKTRKRAAGWLPWGRCPLAMVMSGELDSTALHDQSIVTSPDAKPCGHTGAPCHHALQEQRFRRDKHEKRELQRAEQYKAEATKEREEASARHTETIDALRDGQAMQAETLRAALAALAPQAAADDDRGGKRR